MNKCSFSFSLLQNRYLIFDYIYFSIEVFSYHGYYHKQQNIVYFDNISFSTEVLITAWLSSLHEMDTGFMPIRKMQKGMIVKVERRVIDDGWYRWLPFYRRVYLFYCSNISTSQYRSHYYFIAGLLAYFLSPEISLVVRSIMIRHKVVQPFYIISKILFQSFAYIG